MIMAALVPAGFMRSRWIDGHLYSRRGNVVTL